MSFASPSRAIVNLTHYAYNLAMIRRIVGAQTRTIAIIKADAYGHGILPIARKALESGAAMLGVATVDEGLALREAGISAPILVLFQPCRDALTAAVAQQLTLMISDVETANHLGDVALRANKVAPVHCMIDTGMSRQGFGLDAAPDELQYVSRISRIDIEGVATHFPVADKAEDTFTYTQIKAFRQLLKRLGKTGIPFEVTHAANSAAVINYPSSYFDMVRPGLMTFGVWPSEAPERPGLLKRALRWETRVTQVRMLEPGSSIGYGRTYTTENRMRAAVLAIGYADGYKHSLSNKAEVLIRGKRCPVRGSVCMDQTVVDVSALADVQDGDIVTLIGADGTDEITAEELARHAGTIPYDILTGIGNRVPREYVS